MTGIVVIILISAGVLQLAMRGALLWIERQDKEDLNA